jgi:CheY-like chemotaxis protein
MLHHGDRAENALDQAGTTGISLRCATCILGKVPILLVHLYPPSRLMSGVPDEPLPPPPAHQPPAVLVIDDDASMRAAVRRFLEREGYQVVESSSGRDALAQLREGVGVQLIITDLKMKDGSGGWLLAQLGYEFPPLLTRTLVVSGEADGAAAAHVVARWRCPLLPKPFGAAELIDALQELERAT